jgi:hypothetical protein
MWPSRWIQPAPFLAVAFVLSACVPATHHGQSRPTDSFSLDVPAQWQVIRNRRLLGHHQLVLQAPDKCCTIVVERRREDRFSRELPLSLLADTLPLQAGRIHGMAGEPIAHHKLDLRGREAWATTLIRHNGPRSWLVTSIFLRADGDLFILTLAYPRNAGSSVSLAWERVVNSFDIPGSPAPDTPPWDPEPFLDDPPSQAVSEPT